MAEFQVRVASEVIYYFEQLKKIYNDDENSEITRSQILMRAYKETNSIDDWTPIIEKKMVSQNDFDYLSGHGTNIKVQISDEAEKGIRNLKYRMPAFTNTRSVTLGVTVKYVLKGALVLNKTGQVVVPQVDSINTQIKLLETDLKEIVASANYDRLETIISTFKIGIIKKK